MIQLRSDLSTPEKRMEAPIHHVRCGECDACQEYLLDPPTAPLCDHARNLVRCAAGDLLGCRAYSSLQGVGWLEPCRAISGRGWRALAAAQWVVEYV